MEANPYISFIFFEPILSGVLAECFLSDDAEEKAVQAHPSVPEQPFVLSN